MKIILSIEEFKAKEPVYSFKLPEYMQQILMLTENEYYQAGMFAAQRLIDAYMQNYLSKKEWDISKLDKKLQEKIKDILFMQFQYMHENQLFFEKTQDISYSTSGQQTFTFNTNFNADDDFPLIPKTIKRMIINTGILHYANSKNIESTNLSVFENQFLDGYFVPEVNWSDKANNELAINGNNVTVHNAIRYIYANGIFNENNDYKHAIEITKLFSKKQQILELSNSYIKYNTFYPNKQEFDLAQIKDLSDLWNATNIIVDNNSIKIQQLLEKINNLENNKVDNERFSTELANKANVNLTNINVGPNSVRRYVQVDTSGNIVYSVASGDLKISKWKNDVNYSEGEAIYIENPNEVNSVLIFIANNKEDNINKNPIIEIEYWSKYDIQIDLENLLTKQDANLNYLRLDGAYEMQANLDMGGFELVNCNNVITIDNIQDNQVANNSLWSSSKIIDYINSIKTTIKIIKYEVGQVIAFSSKEAFLMIANAANKTEGIDYEYFENDILIGNNENDEIKGNNIIQKNNLPNLNFKLLLPEYSFGSYSAIGALYSDTNKIYHNDTTGENWRGLSSSNKDNDGETWTWYLNDNVQQVEFIPKRQSFCFVKILKTWYDNEASNIGGDSNNQKYYGQYPIIIDNEKNIISFNDENFLTKNDSQLNIYAKLNDNEQTITAKSINAQESFNVINSGGYLFIDETKNNSWIGIFNLNNQIVLKQENDEYIPKLDLSLVNKKYVDQLIRTNQEELTNIVNENKDYIDNTIKPTYSANKWNNAWTRASNNETEISTIKTTLDNKQDTLTAGDNITINNNVISANVPNWDLSNYYTKQEIDQNINGINEDIRSNTNDIVDLNQKLETTNENMHDLHDLLGAKQNQLVSNNNITVNADNTLSIVPSVFNGYATHEWVFNQLSQPLQETNNRPMYKTNEKVGEYYVYKFFLPLRNFPVSDNINLCYIGSSQTFRGFKQVTITRKRNDGQLFVNSTFDLSKTQIFNSGGHIKAWIVAQEGWTNELSFYVEALVQE